LSATASFKYLAQGQVITAVMSRKPLKLITSRSHEGSRLFPEFQRLSGIRGRVPSAVLKLRVATRM
jgi:hypothetical protein